MKTNHRMQPSGVDSTTSRAVLYPLRSEVEVGSAADGSSSHANHLGVPSNDDDGVDECKNLSDKITWKPNIFFFRSSKDSFT